MSTWSLSNLLEGLHDDIQQKLELSRKAFNHPGTKGDACEEVWLELFKTYLPQRYQAARAHVVDSRGVFSDQIDVVIFDRQYSPFIFKYNGQTIIPAESVYAVFECKQSISLAETQYAAQKVASVRKLHRTSLPIPHAGGVYPAKPQINILGGMLTFESDWTPAMGDPFLKAVLADTAEGKLNIGCVAAHGFFFFDDNAKDYKVVHKGKPATAFLLKLISQLQFVGTVPMIDVMEYSKWLTA